MHFPSEFQLMSFCRCYCLLSLISQGGSQYPACNVFLLTRLSRLVTPSLHLSGSTPPPLLVWLTNDTSVFLIYCYLHACPFIWSTLKWKTRPPLFYTAFLFIQTVCSDIWEMHHNTCQEEVFQERRWWESVQMWHVFYMKMFRWLFQEMFSVC